MYELDFALQAVTTLSRISATASRLESAVCRADDWFQEHIAPAAKYYALVVVAEFARAAYITFVAGQNASEWYQEWFYQYIVEAVPAIIEEPQPLLCGVAYAGHLMPAREADKVAGKAVRRRKAKKCAK